MTQALILVVEDNISLLEGLRELLEMSGYRALTAADASGALELLETHRPDLIVSDIMMPGIDGYELYERVRRRPELLDVPFIFLTARGEKADIRRGKELGADDYITKPFEEEDLLIAVRAKLARSQALRSQREQQFADLKRSILATLSHEFRTPLTYIINYSDLLGKEAGELSSEEFKQFMDGIRKGAERLHRLVLDFITLVELQTGEAQSAYHLRRRVIDDVSPWLRTVAKRHKKQAKERGLELVVRVPEELPPIVADEVYLSNAIGRLVDNAIKFSKKDSTSVQFRAAERESRLLIEVEDTGVGIQESELESLFHVFQQLDRSKHEQQGTGSGLAICKGIVDLHGGKVGATSQYGVGSTFWIELPSVYEQE